MLFRSLVAPSCFPKLVLHTFVREQKNRSVWRVASVAGEMELPYGAQNAPVTDVKAVLDESPEA